MPRIAYLVSSASEIALADGATHPTGYFAEEAIKPYEKFVAAGADVVVLTPDGRPPTADPYGLEYFFHFPEQDMDFFASVTRTFHHDPDDIWITLHHTTELGLVAVRRIAERLRERGATSAGAHALVSKAAKIAWREDRQLTEVMVTEALDGGLSRAEIQAAVDELEEDARALSAERKRKLDAIPGFRAPVSLASLSDSRLAEFDAVFAPGGHGPMVDLADNPDAGRLLKILHDKGAPIATLCHGPALLLSAPEREDGQWLFDGYRMTCFTDEEEDQTAPGRIGMQWYLDAALKNAGAVFDDAPSAWVSHVVVDRNLITGQNPGSTEATADAVLKALGIR
ncbi:type 1 glutamine amidotransferase domain-containing protein [Streptomyces sp. TP-A0356]|uniref:type 1 glutamine amidotransferase domain-containing protein n=1 Tax=Streptomyces sp. TP-A0356 TaxID=1359208 RepID=UPI0006E3BB76|nr:type 1 glutamine amidotransferase domain-containing protein [Streptomyces sp. TP-A0356]